MHRISDAIRTDHRNLEAYYDRIADAQDSDEQTRYQNQFTWELARHVVGEELVLYPALEAQLPDGDTGEDRQQQHTVSCNSAPPPEWKLNWTLHRSKKSSRCFKT